MQYRRVYAPGATYFFTVNLNKRADGILINKIDALRHAVSMTKKQYPFKTVAYAVLPDHLHFMMGLPEEDHDFSIRWRMIKSLFTRQIAPREFISNARRNKQERGI